MPPLLPVEVATPLSTDAPKSATGTGSVCADFPAVAAMSGRARRKNPFNADVSTPTTAAACGPKLMPTSGTTPSSPGAALVRPPPPDTPAACAPDGAGDSGPQAVVDRGEPSNAPPTCTPDGAGQSSPRAAADKGEPSTATASTRRSGYNTRSVSFYSSPTTGLPVQKEHSAASPSSVGDSTSPRTSQKRAAPTRGRSAVVLDVPPASKRPRRASQRLQRRNEDAAANDRDDAEVQPVAGFSASVAGRPDSSECLLLLSASKVVARGRLVKNRKVFHGVPVDSDVVVVTVLSVCDALCKYPLQSRYRWPGRRRTVKRLADLLGNEVVWSCEFISFAA